MIKLKKSKRDIKRIIIHCTATPEGRNVTVEQLRDWHVRGNGWSDIGYHYIIDITGVVHEGRNVDLAGAHTKGYNATSIGVVYVGGLTADGKKSKDTRTPAQKEALKGLIEELRKLYPSATVHGHNEFAKKDCPCFKVWKEFVLAILAIILFGSCASPKMMERQTYKTIVEKEIARDTVIVRDSILRETTTLIREVDSTTMAQYGITLRNDMKAFLVRQNELMKEKNELNKTIEVFREIHDTVYVVKKIPIEEAKQKKTTFWQRIMKGIMYVIGFIICLVVIAILIKNHMKIKDLFLFIKRIVWK